MRECENVREHAVPATVLLLLPQPLPRTARNPTACNPLLRSPTAKHAGNRTRVIDVPAPHFLHLNPFPQASSFGPAAPPAASATMRLQSLSNQSCLKTIASNTIIPPTHLYLFDFSLSMGLMLCLGFASSLPRPSVFTRSGWPCCCGRPREFTVPTLGLPEPLAPDGEFGLSGPEMCVPIVAAEVPTVRLAGEEKRF